MYYFLLVILAILLVVIYLSRQRWHQLSSLQSSFDLQIFRISVPKIVDVREDGKEQTKKIQELLATAEKFFSVIGGLPAASKLSSWLSGRSEIFSFEIVATDGLINFYLACPKKYVDMVEKQLHASYPHALIEPIVDYNIFKPQSFVASACLLQSREFIFPIKTYSKMETDPLDNVLNAVSKLDTGAGAVIQVVCRSAHKKWHKKGLKVVKGLQKGKKLSEALSGSGFGGFINFLERFIKFIFSDNNKHNNSEEVKAPQRLSAMEEEMAKGIEEKLAKAGFDVNIRFIVAANNQEIAEQCLRGIVEAYLPFSIYQYGNAFKVKADKPAVVTQQVIHRIFDPRRLLLLNTEELVSLFHLPLPSCDTPNINWLQARTATPPPNLPKDGLLLGINRYRGQETKVYIKEKDRQRHVYMIGQTGTGKSVLQANMAIQDIQAGRGVCVIDPHGDLIEELLSFIPPERANDLILFDPADFERPLGLNMLEFNTPEQKTFVVNEMINIFDRLYDLKATGGPIFEQYMRNALMLVMEDPESGATLLETPKVLADAQFRKYKLTKCNNIIVRDFWTKEAEKAGGDASLQNMVPYITSKLTPFVASDLVRPIVAQQKSAFNFREVMDQKKILLVSLAKGKIGDMSAQLLGMIIVGKLLFAALSRVDQPEAERKDFYLYIDEFQNFTTDSVSTILSEARKYRLNLTIAHQYISQLVKNNDTHIRDAVFGNCGTIISFRIGPDDAPILVKQYAPVFSEYDVLNVPKFSAFIRMLIDNQVAPAFSFATLAPTTGDLSIVPKLKELSRLRYGADRNLVEKEIQDRLSLATAVSDNF
jgi:hypothetical protein